MYIDILLIIAGFTSLYFGSNWLVNGAVRISNHLHIPKVIVGILLVAFGTSAPELFVNLIAAWHNKTNFVLTNVAGSNLTNLLIGFGLCAFFGKLIIERKRFWIDLLFFASVPFIIVLLLLISNQEFLPLYGAAVLFSVMALYFITAGQRNYFPEEQHEARGKLISGIALFLLGILFLYGGGELVIKSAVNIGLFLGISEKILGLTVVAFGTSIPDVMASIAAIRKGENSIAVGNILGSNIFNILFVLGGTLIVSWTNINSDLYIFVDFLMVSLLSALFIGIALKKEFVSKYIGGIFIITFLVYMAFRVIYSS